MEAIDDLSDEMVCEAATWAMSIGLWDGRPVSWDEFTDFQWELEQKLTRLLFSQDPDSFNFQKMAAQFAWIGAEAAQQPLLAKDIELLRLEKDGVFVQTGLGKSISKFWKKHKKEILIGLAVVVVVTAVVVVTTCTGGTAGGGAAVAGGALLDNLVDEAPCSKPRKQHAPASQEVTEDLSTSPSPPQEFNYVPDPFSLNDLRSFNPYLLEEGSYLPPMGIEPVLDMSWRAHLDIYKKAWHKVFPEVDPPFESIQPFGSPECQGTVHFHCGINNNANTIAQGGECLYYTLGREFAVQPHLIHGPSLAKGLAIVGVEKLAKQWEDPTLNLFVPWTAVPKFTLNSSKVSESIDYVAQILAHQADAIIQTNNSNLKQMHVAFSNGGYVFGEALKRLTPEQADTIIVVTCGSTAIIEQDMAHKVYNVIGSEDWPSRLCNGGESGIERKSENANIDIIDQKKTDGILGGHFFMQPEYQKEIGEILNKIKNEKYEIY